MKSVYPRNRLKTIVKTHCRQLKLSNKVDMLVSIQYITESCYDWMIVLVNDNRVTSVES